MKKYQSTILIIAIIVVIVIIILLGKKQPGTVVTPEPMAETTTSETTTPPIVEATVSAGTNQKKFVVDGGNYYFKPDTLTVNKGDEVTITFKNIGGMHDFKIDAFEAATKRLATGSEETITFTADKAGSFEYYCSIGSHRQMGMKGTLVVK